MIGATDDIYPEMIEVLCKTEDEGYELYKKWCAALAGNDDFENYHIRVSTSNIFRENAELEPEPSTYHGCEVTCAIRKDCVSSVVFDSKTRTISIKEPAVPSISEKNQPTLHEPSHDPVNHPIYYVTGAVECIEAIEASMTEAEYRAFLKGQVIKYLWRYEKKENPVQDLKKAHWYLVRLLEAVKNSTDEE